MKTEEYFDKSCYGKDRTNEMPHLGGNFLYYATYPLAKIFFRLSSKNIETAYRLSEKTGFVLIANHISFLDVYSIFAVLKPKINVRFIAKSELFKNKILGKMLALCGAFPIERDSADRTAIKRAARMLKNREVVGIMPEGSRRGKGTKSPDLHSGAAFIARMGGNVPILPCTTVGADKIKQKGKPVNFGKITVIFGQPIFLKDFDFLPKKDRLDAATWYAMRECFAMFNDVDKEDVDMKELFPKSPDYSTVFKEHPLPEYSLDEIDKILDHEKR